MVTPLKKHTIVKKHTATFKRHQSDRYKTVKVLLLSSRT
jgi:large subunit ribosomal protein L32e